MVAALCLLIPAGKALSAADRVVRQEQVWIEGEVVDSEGEPVSGAAVGLNLLMDPDGLDTSTGVFWTGASGRFGSLPFTGRAAAVLAVDSTQTRGATALVTTPAEARNVRLVLEPLCEVSGTVVCDFFDEEPRDSYISIMLEVPGGLPATLVHAEPGEIADFRFLLPPGDYLYNLYAPGIEYRRRDGSFTVRAGEDLALGRLDLGVTNIAHYYGTAPPPLVHTDARGVEPGFGWEDLHGKWILFYLFAYT